MISENLLEELVLAAREVAGHAYAPYSNFPVGAAVLDSQGRIFTGANVENASYSLGCCAERSAVLAMASAGGRRIVAVAVFTPTDVPTRPCGACRQVLYEFGPDAEVILACSGPGRFRSIMPDLFPEPFRLG